MGGAPEGADGQAPAEAFESERLPSGIEVLASDETLVQPNAPSTPSWSLFPDETRPPERATIAEPGPIEAPSLAPNEPEAVDATTPVPLPQTEPEAPAEASSEPSGPARKGWWQRPFRLRE